MALGVHQGEYVPLMRISYWRDPQFGGVLMGRR
jgi:hypothetical protein